ncbi:MAG: anhydro-N-acetylmuramic acid kinase, partial [Planctomycetota bacterium]|nr:anhydro-N-acetylmuramic acid kinase [Planctomycetota bacterium]
LGDRNPKIAEENRLLLLVNAHQSIEAIYLPASDGLDATIPAISHNRCPDQHCNETFLRERISQELSRAGPLRLKVIWDETLYEQYSCLVANPANLSSSRIGDLGFSAETLPSVATAFLANAFIDQLPVSIPELTGNLNPRVLGSMTPGSLVNFRNFVLEISKVTPSIMKLRDAI